MLGKSSALLTLSIAQVRFLESLGPQIERLPRDVLLYKLLPLFRNYVPIGDTPSSPAHAMQQRRMIMAALPSILQICSTQVRDIIKAVYLSPRIGFYPFACFPFERGLSLLSNWYCRSG